MCVFCVAYFCVTGRIAVADTTGCQRLFHKASAWSLTCGLSPSVIYIYVLGKMNENGEMLADFCAFNNMIIGGSVFPHRRIHKATWVSPDHRTENQIDHICIGRKFRRSMQDVRVQRGADAASDHHLVLARMKMKLKKREVKRSTRTQYNVDFLKDRLTTETFRLTVRNKYEALQDLLDEGNMDIDTQWQQIKEMWTSTCSEVLGKKKYQQKDWISADTQQSASEEGKERCN